MGGGSLLGAAALGVRMQSPSSCSLCHGDRHHPLGPQGEDNMERSSRPAPHSRDAARAGIYPACFPPPTVQACLLLQHNLAPADPHTTLSLKEGCHELACLLLQGSKQANSNQEGNQGPTASGLSSPPSALFPPASCFCALGSRAAPVFFPFSEQSKSFKAQLTGLLL